MAKMASQNGGGSGNGNCNGSGNGNCDGSGGSGDGNCNGSGNGRGGGGVPAAENVGPGRQTVQEGHMKKTMGLSGTRKGLREMGRMGRMGGMRARGRRLAGLAQLLAIALILCIMASCGGAATGGAATTAAPAAGGAATTAAGQDQGQEQGQADFEPVSVNILMDFNIMDGIDSLTDNKYVDFIEEKTGVKIVMDSPGPAGYNDKLNIVMASGAEVDAFMANRDQINKFALDGILTDLSPYIHDAAKYPNIDAYMAPNTWLPVTNDEGVWGFPYSRFDAFTQVVFVQKPWMEALNLEIPTTIDEYYEVMRAFTYDDPDGNGQDDTFGLLAGSSLFEGARIFKAAFDAESYKVIDGVVTPAVITENYKDYLKFISKLVAEKIMDPEWPTTTVSIYMDKLKTYKYGMTSYFWHANQLPEYDQGTVHENWLSLDLPKGRDGQPSHFTYDSLNRNYVGIPTTSSKVDALMRVYDWTCSPDEGERWLYLGVEGDEYSIGADGAIEVLKQRNSLHWMFTMVSPGILNDNVKKYLELTYPKETVERLDISTRNGQLDELAASLPYYPDLVNFNLTKVTDEYNAKAILGNVDIDATWDDYVTKYKVAGGEAAMKFWTDWYNASQQ
ncbi:MAG: extracellular solute-binding protein [Clostridiales bacterium]|jgi:putative aldouronate transport system substrate-binding protein|nr:extracellular solute-binding protein [Clostridiales bacterium]